MSEQTMKCKDCVLKHIANAMSYAKEILAGHGIGGTPDHRPDYLGELVNAEHHLEHISVELLNRVMVIRTAAQMRRMMPVETEIDSLREIWIAVEAFDVPDGVVMTGSLQYAEPVQHTTVETKTDRPVHIYNSYPDLEKMDKVGYVMAEEWFDEDNDEKRRLFISLAGKHAPNAVFYTGTDVVQYEGKYLWVFPFNCFINQNTDMKQPTVAHVSEGRKASYIPRLVETSKYLEAKERTGLSDPVDILDAMELPPMSPQLSEEYAVVMVTRKPCCSVKSRLRTQPFVKVDDNGWPYMKGIWEADVSGRPLPEQPEETAEK